MNQEQGLSNITIVFMIVVAVFFDLIQALLQMAPIVGQILASVFGFVAFLIFYIWFKIKGQHFATVKRGALLVGGLAIESIPVINILPAWTLSITLLAINSKVKKVVPGLDIIKK